MKSWHNLHSIFCFPFCAAPPAKRPKPDEKNYSSSIWGPTCDGLAGIVERCNVPEMRVGDWMLFEKHGRLHSGCCFHLQWIPEADHLQCEVGAHVATDAADLGPRRPPGGGAAGCWPFARVLCSRERDGASPGSWGFSAYHRVNTALAAAHCEFSLN